jgi:transcription-repair coupling factor (superfamily II helicase)
VLICADSAGRRETLMQYFNEFQIQPVGAENFQDFLTGSETLQLTVMPLHRGLPICNKALR